mmetsp:Transcript_1782/g.1701  ORF Transcript_1782/g.1701 Transcript_1782/m.1701 type:complete len:122 (+) Transcript_1782:1014-1379(+)
MLEFGGDLLEVVSLGQGVLPQLSLQPLQLLIQLIRRHPLLYVSYLLLDELLYLLFESFELVLWEGWGLFFHLVFELLRHLHHPLLDHLALSGHLLLQHPQLPIRLLQLLRYLLLELGLCLG